MSDECLMKQEFGFPFYIVYQAVMRKFTLAGKRTIGRAKAYNSHIFSNLTNIGFDKWQEPIGVATYGLGTLYDL